MAEWQPISTAPKDGTWVLIWIDKAMWQAGVDEPGWQCQPAQWDYCGFYERYGWIKSNDALVRKDELVTHWMPLPEPPDA